MFTKITTTITTTIDLDSFKPDHSVVIEPEDGDLLPNEVIYAAVRGALKATLNSIPGADNGDEDDE